MTEEYIKYKLIIAGTRDFSDMRLFMSSIREFMQYKNLKPKDVEIVSGTAKGADIMGEFLAKKKRIQLKQFKPNWSLGSYCRDA